MRLMRVGSGLFGCGAMSMAAIGLATVAPAAAVDFVPGSPGLGDPFFPNAGNGGYDVAHYSLTLSLRAVHEPAVGHRRDHGDRDAEPVQLRPRSAGLLDLAPARQRAAPRPSPDGEQELVITPRAGLRAGTVFTVVIDYAGTPAVVTDPDQSIEGWIPTDDGAFVVGEPQGSPAWYPVNDNPRDKATFDFSITVPAGLTAMANGVLVSNADGRWQRRPGSGRRPIRWPHISPRRRSAGST